MTREFVSRMIPTEFKSDKAVIINRSNDVVKAGKVNVTDYAKKVFNDDVIAGHFTGYVQKKAGDLGMDMDTEFLSSQQAIKKKKTTALTSIKLDQNFDIHIHGGDNLLEKGYDEEKGMKYYKLYFKEEK